MYLCVLRAQSASARGLYPSTDPAAAFRMNARLRYLPELVDQHLEDLAFLWGQRREALMSTEHTQRNWADLEERIEAHLQGLRVPPTAALLTQLQPRLSVQDGDEAFALASALRCHRDRGATQAVLSAFVEARGEAP